MPSLKEAAALVVGTIIALEESVDFDTKKVDGVIAILHTPDGFAKVRLKHAAANEVRPTVGQRVSWLLRWGANGGADRAASAYSAFVRIASREDVVSIGQALGLDLSKVAAA